MAKWIEDERMSSDSEDDEPLETNQTPRIPKFLPKTLEQLFGGKVARPIRRESRQFDRETLMMELLAAEHEEESVDDGAKSGSGDDYGT